LKGGNNFIQRDIFFFQLARMSASHGNRCKQATYLLLPVQQTLNLVELVFVGLHNS
jgi:hypothetical protein